MIPEGRMSLTSMAASVLVLAAHMKLREGGLVGLRVETGGKVHERLQQQVAVHCVYLPHPQPLPRCPPLSCCFIHPAAAACQVTLVAQDDDGDIFLLLVAVYVLLHVSEELEGEAVCNTVHQHVAISQGVVVLRQVAVLGVQTCCVIEPQLLPCPSLRLHNAHIGVLHRGDVLLFSC